MSERFKEALADIEREVGRISTFLQCGDFHGKDLANELKSAQECQSDLGELIEETEEALERAGEDSRSGQRYAEELGWMEDAISPLGMAEEALMDLVKDPTNKRLISEAISQLDSACDCLTRAMGVWR